MVGGGGGCSQTRVVVGCGMWGVKRSCAKLHKLSSMPLSDPWRPFIPYSSILFLRLSNGLSVFSIFNRNTIAFVG